MTILARCMEVGNASEGSLARCKYICLVRNGAPISDYARTWCVGCCDIEHPSETHIKLRSREISFAHNSLRNCQIVLKYCTEHGSITAVLCAKFQNDLTNEMDVLDERDFARFEFEMSFGRISHVATALRSLTRNGGVATMKWCRLSV